MPIPKGELVQQTEETAPIAEGNPVVRAPSGIPKGEPVEQDAPPAIPEGLQVEDPGGTFIDKAIGAGEASISLARRGAGEVAAGVSGLLFNLPLRAAAGQKDVLGKTVEHMEWLSDAVSGDGPQTEQGKIILENLENDPRAEGLARQAQEAGDMTLERTGSPAAATAVRTALEFLPALAGSRRGFDVKPRRGDPDLVTSQRDKPTTEVVEETTDPKVRKKDLKRFNELLQTSKIDVSSKRRLFESLQEIGENIQKEGYKSSIYKVHDAVRELKDLEERSEAFLWERAKKGDEAYVPKKQVENFFDELNQRVREGFNVDRLPRVKSVLDELDGKVLHESGGSSTKISALQEWRKSINSEMPTDKKSPEYAVLQNMKHQLDNFIENQFVTDMIRGDAESVARWRAAIDQTASLKKRFEPDNIIRKFAKHNINAQQLRNYLFNASSVDAGPSAELTIKRLKDILGPDSNEMMALRQESLFNVMEPLIKERPDFDAFSERYTKFVKKNPELTKELFDKKSREALRLLNSAAKSAEKRRGLADRYGSIPKALSDMTVVGLLGHGIAQAGLKVRVAKTIVDRMFETGGTAAKKEMMEDFLGYDPKESIFRTPAKRAAAIEGTVQAVQEEQEDDK